LNTNSKQKKTLVISFTKLSLIKKVAENLHHQAVDQFAQNFWPFFMLFTKQSFVLSRKFVMVARQKYLNPRAQRI